ncbi:MAG: hypothetical protein IIZ42_00970 [Eubacterium sp.]|nr:hypothetical protein [Eubacterium sp.]
MSVLLKGMNMPRDGERLKVWIEANGQVIVDKRTYYEEYEAVDLPDHGDLIDRDALRNEMRLSESCSRCERDAYRCQYYEEMTVMDVCERIDDAPVVIPAERSEE